MKASASPISFMTVSGVTVTIFTFGDADSSCCKRPGSAPLIRIFFVCADTAQAKRYCQNEMTHGSSRGEMRILSQSIDGDLIMDQSQPPCHRSKLIAGRQFRRPELTSK